jgi:TPR repeat protein
MAETESSSLVQRAEAGEAGAQCDLGIAHAMGDAGGAASITEAARWFRKAADQGHAGGQYNLAGCYYDGEGLPVDTAEAAKLYLAAGEPSLKRAVGFRRPGAGTLCGAVWIRCGGRWSR